MGPTRPDGENRPPGEAREPSCATARMSPNALLRKRNPTLRRSDTERKERPRGGSPPPPSGVCDPSFPWSSPLPQGIVLKRRPGSPEFNPVATTARETELDLLHYVIETQRVVN